MATVDVKGLTAVLDVLCLFVGFDPCDSNPCQNNGSCVTHLKTYTCSCQPEFTGVHCETRTYGGRTCTVVRHVATSPYMFTDQLKLKHLDLLPVSQLLS